MPTGTGVGCGEDKDHGRPADLPKEYTVEVTS
jgi:hypothetical protein